MKERLIRQFAFSREELKNRLLAVLVTAGIQIQGEVKMTFTEWGCLLEEFLPFVDGNGREQNKP